MADIWEEMWPIIHDIRDRGVFIEVQKVKAHTKGSEVNTPQDTKGNETADLAAIGMAHHHDLLVHERRKIQEIETQS